jgi:DNA segregation ATPase FtsK/SpoIIIE, S-DNA-T family
MIVTMLGKGRYISLTLPEKVAGKYWLTDNDNKKKELISIEASNAEWVLKSNRKYSIVDSSQQVLRNTVIKKLSVYNLIETDTNEKVLIFVEPNDINRQMYTKVIVPDNISITVGRNQGNDFVIENQFISGEHFKLTFSNKQWLIEDLNSTNGTYVNGRKVDSQPIYNGDLIYVMGFKFIVAQNFIACTMFGEGLRLTNPQLRTLVPQKVEADQHDDEQEPIPQKYFYRSPQFKRNIEEVEFKIDSPPPNAIGEEMPLIYVLGPSITMGMASLATASFAVTNAMSNNNAKMAIPAIIMACSMLLGSVLWPTLSRKFDRKRRHKKEAIRQKKYKHYLEQFMVKVQDEMMQQAEILHENILPVNECLRYVEERDVKLWGRVINHDDFLKLRIGLGEEKLKARIVFNEKKFSIEDDNLEEEMQLLCSEPKIMENVPKTIDLKENRFVGIVGPREERIAYLKGLIMQMASLHSYDELKMVFVYNDEDQQHLEFVKWLPHVWNEDKSFRYIATNKNELKELGSYFEKELEMRLALNTQDLKKITSHFVIFSLDNKLSNEIQKKVFTDLEKDIKVSIISVDDEMKYLTKETSIVIELDGTCGKVYDKSIVTGDIQEIDPDIKLSQSLMPYAIQLANMELETSGTNFNLPTMITFLELFKVGKVEHLNALTRWKENDPTKSLQAEIGVNTMGETFYLDLHEKFHGPHGLIAGMTGSGKSEFIISYILSLAVNYHPNELAFILIDYKGGGMAKSFENLPHTAGIITNLDGSAIKRSLVSIESELKRRQAIFAEASKMIGESNIDIYKYQRLVRDGVMQEPLQHLFIISDEFAELKTQQPEFMAKLVSAARIGRSLGVHLILATQKPSGVVDDQIWSNSKFRVSLKVQDKSDSMEMLKRPDAAELKETGRFYLQVGYNELFELGQSAWAGASYYPSDEVVTEKENSVVVIDINGRPIRAAKPAKKRMQLETPKKQLDVITNYLSNIALEESIKIRQLWLEPISENILLDNLYEKYNVVPNSNIIMPVIGEYDDPVNQKQAILRLNFSEDGNAIIYGTAGSGKTTLLNALIVSLMKEHSPDTVNMYLLDFASETLRAFEKAPHVGEVILSHEGEKIANLFKMMKREVETRKALFADYGGSRQMYVNSTGNAVPAIIIAINNYSAFTELYEEREEAINYLSREGTKYGIYFILTAVSTSSVRFRLLQNFKQQLTLQLNDDNDYAIVVGKTGGLVPSKFKGRGLVRREEVYEFQTAKITLDENPYQEIVTFCKKIVQLYPDNSAVKIPILPKNVDIPFLKNYNKGNGISTIPIGVNKTNLLVECYNFQKSYLNLISSNGNGGTTFTSELIKFVDETIDHPIYVLDYNNELELENLRLAEHANTLVTCQTMIEQIFSIVLSRNNAYKEAIEAGILPEQFDQIVVFIQSPAALLNTLEDEMKQRLQLILEKGEAHYNINIILNEKSRELQSISFDNWYKNKVVKTEAIWIGSGLDDQHKIDVNKTPDLRKDYDLSDEFGYIIRNRKAIKLKVLNPIKEEEEYEQSFS